MVTWQWVREYVWSECEGFTVTFTLWTLGFPPLYVLLVLLTHWSQRASILAQSDASLGDDAQVYLRTNLPVLLCENEPFKWEMLFGGRG